MSFRRGDVIVRADAAYPEGALVVDGFDQNENLLAHPMGGGLQLRIFASDVPRFMIPDELEKIPVFRRARFSIDGIDVQFEGWSDGRHWNGWTMPRFEFAPAQIVVATLDPNNGRYNTETDSFITVIADSEEESWPGEIIALPDGGAMKVYPIGAGSWIWEEKDSSWV